MNIDTLEKISSSQLPNPAILLPKKKPYFMTNLGAAYSIDSLNGLKELPTASVNLVVTSPPYALEFKKAYGNESKEDYIKWFLPFAHEIKRILTDDGSFVLNIGGSWNSGSPTRSLYHFKLLISLVEEVGLFLAQECFWYNPAKLPVPAEWVTVRRIRIKDSVEHVWWLSKSPWPKADNRKVLRPYSKDMLRLNLRGVKTTQRPSGHNITESFDKIAPGGSIPPNLLEPEAESLLRFGNNTSNDRYTRRCKEEGIKPHPARFPSQLPEMFIKLLTETDEIVLDPFAGSNTSGRVAETLGRRWLAFEREESYLKASRFRFEE